MKTQHVVALSCLCVMLMSMTGIGAFTAYNDCVPNQSANPANTTGIGLGTGSVSSGVLKDFATGAGTGVTLTVTHTNAGLDGTGPATAFTAGTDAAQAFAGKVDFLNRVIWYGSASDWYVDMVFSGLNPAMTYDITTTMDRGVASSTDRWTKIRISDADAYTYACSPGTWKVGTNNDTVSIASENTVRGYVARWTGIKPGADGDFAIRYTYCSNTPGVEIPLGASEGMASGVTPYGYGPGGVMLVGTPEPTSIGLLVLGGLGLLRRRQS